MVDDTIRMMWFTDQEEAKKKQSNLTTIQDHKNAWALDLLSIRKVKRINAINYPLARYWGIGLKNSEDRSSYGYRPPEIFNLCISIAIKID